MEDAAAAGKLRAEHQPEADGGDDDADRDVQRRAVQRRRRRRGRHTPSPPTKCGTSARRASPPSLRTTFSSLKNSAYTWRSCPISGPICSECLELASHGPTATPRQPKPRSSRAATSSSSTTGCSAASCSANSSQAARLMCPDKAVKSLHTVFAREGRADEPVTFEADSPPRGPLLRHADDHRAGRRNRGVLATSSVCMHVVEDGPEHQDVADVAAGARPEHRLALDLIPWETRADRRPQRHRHRSAGIRILDAHTGCRPGWPPRSRRTPPT